MTAADKNVQGKKGTSNVTIQPAQCETTSSNCLAKLDLKTKLDF